MRDQHLLEFLHPKESGIGHVVSISSSVTNLLKLNIVVRICHFHMQIIGDFFFFQNK